MKQFLPFLTDDQGRSLDVENEVVVTRSMPNPIDHSPEGWENNTIQFARNNEFRGIIKSYTTSLKFYLEGAKILRDAFYRKGMETVIFFIWLKQNTAFGAGMKYEGWYKGDVDFGTFKDDYTGVSVNITEGGFYKDLQSNKTVKYEIPFDEDAVTLYLHAMQLNQKLNYSDIEDLEVKWSIYGDQFFGPVTFLSQDGASYGFLIESEGLESISGALSFDEFKKSTNVILRNVSDVPVTINIAGTIEFECTVANTGRSVRFRYITSNMDIANQNDYQIISAGSMDVGTTYTEDFDLDITLAPGESLLRQGIFFGGSSTEVGIKFTANSKSTINFTTRKPATTILAYRVFDLGNKLTGKVSSGATLSSPDLLEPDVNLLVTSGDAIRSLPDAVIKTTFSDYHKSVDAVKCIALSVENNRPVISSRYTKFNKDSSISNLGECRNWELEPADEFVFDQVQIGYPAKNSDSNIDVNGKYSFNNTFLWKLNVTRRKNNTYDAKSVYMADPWDITIVQLNFDGRSTTTSNTDNENFFLDAELKTDLSYTGSIQFTATGSFITLLGSTLGIRDSILPGSKIVITGSTNNDGTYTVISKADLLISSLELKVNEVVVDELAVTATANIANLYQLRRPTFASITGIPSDGTVFNILLSPRRILQNHLRWLRSSFDLLDTAKLVFQTTEKNKDLVTTDNSGNVVSEKADIPVSEMGERVYRPYYVTFEIKSPYNLLELMTANNSGKFDYTLGGLAMDGFPIDIKTQEAHLETQQYKLLQTANNDNTQLISR